MNYMKFTNASGDERYVNLENVTVVKITGDKARVKIDEVVYEAPAEEFKKAIKPEKANEYSPVLMRLIDAINRLTIRIPSSIRLHM